MKCRNCDFETEEELLYCPSCGHEVQLVPEYKIEEVDKVLEAISLEEEDASLLVESVVDSQVEEFFENANLGEVGTHSQENMIGSRFSRKIHILLTIFVLIFLCCLGVYTVIMNTRNNSYEYQIEKAIQFIKEEEYDRAIMNLERALFLDSKDPKAKLMLANIYCTLDKEDVAIMLLLDTIRSGGELVEVYTTLIKIYEQNEDYELISELLEQSTDMMMKQNFQQYVADVPDFSIAGGVFEDVVPLKILSNVSGTIYYTVNGGNPTSKDAIYESPIFLEDGTFEVRACYENEFGVMSDVVSQIYVVELATPRAPEVEVYTGDYEVPILITVHIPNDTSVYYTIDGDIPTQNSSSYTKPIPMRVGKHVYQFVAIDEKGVASEVISRTLNLSFEAVYSTNQAKELVEDFIITQTIEGSEYSTLSGSVTISCSSAVMMNGSVHYLAIEYYDDGQGSIHRTGNEYFVNVQTGNITRAVWESTSGYREEPL